MIPYFRKVRAHVRCRLCARHDRGATAVEYGLMVTFIAVAIIVAVTAFGSSVAGLFAMIAANAPFG